MVPMQMAIFGDFLRPVFSASHVQQHSDLHLKFALRSHHDIVWKYGRHPICSGRLGEEKMKKRKIEQTTVRKYNGRP